MAKQESTGGGADPSKLPAHLRPMVGAKRQSGKAAGGDPAQPAAAGQGPGQSQGQGWKTILRNWWFVLFVMPVLVFVRCNVWSPYKIPTGSMEPELLGNDDNGDRVLVNLYAYRNNNPQRWDIAVFKSPELKDGWRTEKDTKDTEYVKRCVGLAGDRIVISGGDLYNVVAEAGGGERFELLRKPEDLQASVWHTLYNFPPVNDWESPAELVQRGDWQPLPTAACQPAADNRSWRMTAAEESGWQLRLRRTADTRLGATAVAAPGAEPNAGPAAGSEGGPVMGPVAGPVLGPVAGPVLEPVAGPVVDPDAEGEPTAEGSDPVAGESALSPLTNRYLKAGDYWFRIPDSGLAPFRAHIRGSETTLVVPDDIQPEYPDDSAAQAAAVKRWKGRRLYPIPLTWYAGNAEIPSHLPITDRDRNAELWRLNKNEKATWYMLGSNEAVPESIAAKRDWFQGTSVRIGQSYGGVFGVNDIRLELKLNVHRWGRHFRAVFDQELAPDGKTVLRRYGFTVQNGQAQPWVEEWDAATGRYRSAAQVTLEARADLNAAPLTVATGEQRWVLEHFDGIVRLSQREAARPEKVIASCGFAYNPPPRSMKQHSAGLYLEGQGTDVEFLRIKIARDLYYLWDEFKIMADHGVAGNLQYRTSNENHPQMPEGYLIFRADGLTEFNLTREADSPEKARYLMFGDNTVSSIDSRAFGPVERWRFMGKYWFTFWPPSRAQAVR